MAGAKPTPKSKKPPARNAAGRERARKPIREVITSPSSQVPARAVRAANHLKGTIKGNTGKGKSKTEWSHLPKEGSRPRNLMPLPPNFHLKPDGTMLDPQEFYDAYEKPGTYQITPQISEAYSNLWQRTLYEQKLKEAYLKNPIVQAMQFVDSVGAVVENIPGILGGDAASIQDANIEATNAMNVLRRAVGKPEHVGTQTRVGGQRGTSRPVDRSAAVKLAWAKRRKLYGTSGRKDK